MHTSLRRVAAIAGALIIAGSGALLGASAAQADGNYYGAWTLEGFKVGKSKVDCPGTVPFPPPAPSISCKAGEYLELKSDYTYKTTLDVFSDGMGKGSFDVIKLANGTAKTIVFDSNSDTDNPRAYRVKFQGMSSGMPKKMVVFLTYHLPNGKNLKISMIFRRDAN